MRISIAGSGNVAWHLAQALYINKIEIEYIYSRKVENAQKLASLISAKATNELAEIAKTDIIIFSVSDDALSQLIGSMKWQNQLLLHTAGSIDMRIFEGKAQNYGVFYPLQTLSKSRKPDYSQIPFLLEANTSENLKIITELASKISPSVRFINSEQRRQLHLSAIFICNFSNHLWTIAQKLSEEQNLDFAVFHPLMQETVEKAIDLFPEMAQTGPALRNDRKIIEKHLSMLKNHPLWKKIYSFVSESIYKTKKNLDE